ncbi:MAG: conjugal transfer protein TraB [Betaproteobacteria bacterium]|nr:conjugal transfer protein TraB [Betaproteobacteria bacterium]
MAVEEQGQDSVDGGARGVGYRSPTGDNGFEPTPVFDEAQISDDADKKRKQRLALWAGAAIAVVGVATILATRPNSSHQAQQAAVDGQPKPMRQLDGTIAIQTDDMSAKTMADDRYRADMENRIAQLEQQLNGFSGSDQERARLEGQLQTLRSQRQGGPMRAVPYTGVGARSAAAYSTSGRDEQIAAMQREINRLREAQANAPRVAPPAPGVAYPPRGPGFAAPGTATAASVAAANGGVGVPGLGGNKIMVQSYQSGGKQAERSGLTFADSPNYLPANSIATARVIVGADAPTSVRTQSEPIPVVMRVTTDARSVLQDTHVFRTQIVGCLINGAAYGDLSSEKVFVKLQKMTCNDGHGGVAVSEVKGFVAFAGKAGVRGRVVSREGSFVLKSFLAGIAGGIGKLGQNVGNSQLLSPVLSTGGSRTPIDLGTVAAGAGASGVAGGADAISQYLIQRAEQYQPVVEMPTGIDVEVVFLDGSYVR